jgi:cytidine deaminase
MSKSVERAPPARRVKSAPPARHVKPSPPAQRAPDEPTIAALLAAARRVRAHAHAPYSKFKVGAAVLDERGRIHAGCNAENAAYPQGWCAEASALAAMVAAGGQRVRAVAVVAVSRVPTTPCGGCRQKLAEFAGDDCLVFVAGPSALQRRYTLGELLPHGFGPPALRRP